MAGLRDFAHLPGKEGQVEGVEGDVSVARGVIPLLHGRHKRGGCGPEHNDGCAGIQVRAWEQLACMHSRHKVSTTISVQINKSQPSAAY